MGGSCLVQSVDLKTSEDSRKKLSYLMVCIEKRRPSSEYRATHETLVMRLHVLRFYYLKTPLAWFPTRERRGEGETGAD